MARRFAKKLRRPQDASAPLARSITTIDRLETKGLLKTRMGDATPQRGGRAKRMVRVTAKGVHAAKDFYDTVTRVSRGASWVANRTGSAS